MVAGRSCTYGITKINEYQFPTGAPEMQAMMAGDLDVAYVGAAPAITALSQGLDAKIVEPVQINGSSLVLRPEYEYESPEDLRGLKSLPSQQQQFRTPCSETGSERTDLTRKKT